MLEPTYKMYILKHKSSIVIAECAFEGGDCQFPPKLSLSLIFVK